MLTPDRAKKIGEWLMSDDTGLSSKCIAGVLLGADTKAVTCTPYPRDPADFGRCLRLVRLLDCRSELKMMTRISHEWKVTVDNWDEWAKLYDEESTRSDRCAPKLYDEMTAA